jgi:hypothetical protein
MLSLIKRTDSRVCVDCPGATRASDHFDFPQYRYTPFRASPIGVHGAIEGLAALIAACVVLLIWGQVRLRREHWQ